MKARELREMTPEQLDTRLEGLKEELFNLRFQLATNQLDNAHRIKDVRRDIARVKTEMRERELKIARGLRGGQVMETARNERKERVGFVVSDAMDKTRVVELQRTYKDPMYGKVVRRSSKVKVHDEGNESRVGDKVLIMETRPISRDKRWRLVKIVEKAK